MSALLTAVLLGAAATAGCAASGAMPGTAPAEMRAVDTRVIANVKDAQTRSWGNGFFVSPSGCLVTIRHWPHFTHGERFTLWTEGPNHARVVAEYVPWDQVILKTHGGAPFPIVTLPADDVIPYVGERVVAVNRVASRMERLSRALRTGHGISVLLAARHEGHVLPSGIADVDPPDLPGLRSGLSLIRRQRPQ